MVEEHGFTMPVLLDEGLAATQAYGIATDDGKLPHPTVVVIDEKGKVRWVHLDEDYRRRPSPDTVLDAVRAARSMAGDADTDAD